MGILRTLFVLALGALVGVVLVSPDVATALGLPADPLGSAIGGFVDGIIAAAQGAIDAVVSWIEDTIASAVNPL